MAAMPEAKATALPDSSPPTTSSSASQVGVPSSREYSRPPPRMKFDAGTSGTLSGAPGTESRPAETTHDSKLISGIGLSIVANHSKQEDFCCGAAGSESEFCHSLRGAASFRKPGWLLPFRRRRFDSIGQCFQRVRKRLTQPIGLILPDLFEDRLAKLTEHAAHVDMVIGAIAQHDLRVTLVAQWLQRQAVRVLETKGRSVDASKQ